MSDKNSFTSTLLNCVQVNKISSVYFNNFCNFLYFCRTHLFVLVHPYTEAVKNDQLSRRLIFTALHETLLHI